MYRIKSLLPLVLFTAVANAAPQNEAPVHIEADNMKYDMARGISEYHGNVRVSRESFLLTGDDVVVEQQGSKVLTIRVTGKPAQYTQLNEEGDSITANSGVMFYNATANRLVLTEDAVLHQPGQSVQSQKITYDTANRVIIAGNPAPDEPGDRVNITITPEKSKTP
jgi:lipopolysaccharide transport protein LptA